MNKKVRTTEVLFCLKIIFLKKIPALALLFVFLHLSLNLMAESHTRGESGFVGVKYPESRFNKESTGFRWHQLVVPAVFVTAGSIGVRNGWIHSINTSVRDKVAHGSRKTTCADDYLQYLPLASYLGMGAIGAESMNNFKNRALVAVTSYVVNGILVNGVKHIVKETRPDLSDRHSFPSGHASVAFMGAELVRKEYGWKYGVGAYAVASGVAFLRLYNDGHWLNDIVAGAGIGILSANAAYWLLPLEYKIFSGKKKKKDRYDKDLTMTALPFCPCGNGGLGGAFYIRF